MKNIPAINDLLKRLTCLSVAMSLLVNLTTPAFAQAVAKGRKVRFSQETADNIERTLRKKAFTAVRESTALPGENIRRQMQDTQARLDRGSLTDADLRQLAQADNLFNPVVNHQKNTYATFRAEFAKETRKQAAKQHAKVKEMAAQAKKDLQARADTLKKSGSYSQDRVDEWLKQNVAAVDSWAAESGKKVSAWGKQRDALSKDYYAELEKQNRAEAERQVAAAVKTLFALKDKALLAKRKLISYSVRILPLKTADGKSFFTVQQKQYLHREYTRLLKQKNCKDCSAHLSAVMGLGMISSSREDANLIEDFMTAQRESIYAVPALLGGVSALLAMKQYGVLRGFIASATQQERDISNIDFFSLATLVEVFKNINGQYLGEVSKHTVYPLTKDRSQTAPMGNAWEDVALLLANEGSAQSLAMLKEFGVDRCAAWSKKTVQLKNIYEMGCSGIQPFLVGALESGKSGAESYAPQGQYLQAGRYLTAQGQAKIVSDAQAAANRAEWNNRRAVFNKYVSITGLTASGAIARHLFNQSMGDLSADSELELDRKLYKVYKASAKVRAPKPGYAIKAYQKGSAPYNAKRVRQDRSNWFLKAAKYGDIAILVWCLVDLTKLAAKGATVGRAMFKAMNMARNGATVAERAVMLRRLNVVKPLRTLRNIPVRIRKGMEPVVLAQMPQFAKVPTTAELLKVPGGFVPAASKLVAENLKFSTAAGTLSVGTEAAKHPTVLGENQVAVINEALSAATQRANVEFANRGKLAQLTTFNADNAYRAVLSKEIGKISGLPGYKPGETAALAADIKNLKTVQVPQNIAAFENRSLLVNGQTDGSAVQALLTGVLGQAPTAEQSAFAMQMLADATAAANAQFARRGWLKRKFSRGSYKKLLVSNLTQIMDADRRIFNDAAYGKIGQALLSTVSADKRIKAPSALESVAAVKEPKAQKSKTTQLGSAVLVQGGAAEELPLNVVAANGVSGLGKNTYQRAVFTQGKNGITFGFGNDLGQTANAKNFKLTLDAQQMPEFILAAEKAGLSTPFELKLTAYKKPSSFSFKNWLPQSKEKKYATAVPVLRQLESGETVSVPLTLKADTYLGLENAQMIMSPSGALNFYRDGQLLTDVAPFSYGVRKTQLNPFLSIARQAPQGLRFNMNVSRTGNKLIPLYIATGLSLSSASSSLIAPLENIYGERITETDKTMISLALPYIPSLLTPVFSPLVMKIGALKTVKMALGTALFGMAFAGASGFYGKVNESNLPPIWPLFVSGAAIGMSSALNRSGLNLLIDRIGGGGSLLTSMAFKNIGSFAMLVPPVAANLFAPGATDFSLAFPVLGTISAGSLASLYFSRIDPNIGKVAGFMKFAPMSGGFAMRSAILAKNARTLFRDGWGETWGSLRILASKELLPLTAAAFAFTGFEAATFNKAANQLIRPEVTDFGWINEMQKENRKNWVALVTSGTVVLFPLLTRLRAKPMLAALKDPAKMGSEYQRMLMLSYGMNMTGSAMMMHYGFDGFDSPGFLGIALVGVGTANVTQSLQKLANMNVVRGGYVAARTAGLNAAEAAVVRDKAATTAMTVFSLSQTGLAAIPLTVSHYTDKHIQAGIEERSDVPRTSLWIPLTSLGASAAFAGPSIGLFPKVLPTGLFGLTKGLFGSYSQAFTNAFEVWRPSTVAPYGVPAGFVPMPAVTAEPAKQEPAKAKK